LHTFFHKQFLILSAQHLSQLALHFFNVTKKGIRDERSHRSGQFLLQLEHPDKIVKVQGKVDHGRQEHQQSCLSIYRDAKLLTLNAELESIHQVAND
jgi:hypothetical protein